MKGKLSYMIQGQQFLNYHHLRNRKAGLVGQIMDRLSLRIKQLECLPSQIGKSIYHYNSD